jgi:hypothetical protein
MLMGVGNWPKRMAQMTEAERREFAKKGAEVRWRKALEAKA